MAWIEKRSDGGLLVRWRDENGRTRSRKFRDEAQALDFKKTVEPSPVDKLTAEAKRRGEYADPLGELDRWGRKAGTPEGTDERYRIEAYARATVAADKSLATTTQALYLRTVRTHIAGTTVGNADVRTITPADLDSWWGSLSDGDGALRNIHEVLSKMFKRELRQELRLDNPLDRSDVKKPRKKVRRDVRPLTTAEVERLAASAINARDRLEILVMSYGGLRAGEIGGLRDEDVDWQKGRLNLRQQVRRIAGDGLEVAGLKTDAARRVVTLPSSVMDELRAFVDENAPAEDGRVFHGLQDGMRDSVRINASVQKAAKRAGLKTHAHALRHTAVSMWVADGHSPVEVQKMVGHEDVETTLAQYAHLFTYGGQELAESMEKRREAHRNGSK